MHKPLLSLILLLFHITGYCQELVPSEKIIKGHAQGTSYMIRYVTIEKEISKYQIDSILAVLDESLSLYKENSYISRVNSKRKIIQGEEHILNVLSTGLYIQKLSQGVFDVRLYSLSQAWGFGPDPAKRIPSRQKIRRIRPSISDSVWVEGSFIHKSNKKIKIDLDGLAQGYSVDVLSNFLSKQGINNFTVELGGEIRTSGAKPNATYWKIGIESPVDTDHSESLVVKIKDQAITTSGSYRKTRTFRGQHFSHIIDPRTARPLQNNMIACTVVAPSAMLADALDNIAMILGPDAAISFFSNFNSISAYFVWQEDHGRIRSLSTPGFRDMTLSND